MLEAFEKIKKAFKRRQAKKQAKIRQEFLPEALEIVEKPLSPTGHMLVLILLGIVLFFVIWSICGKMDEVVTSRGIIITVAGVQEIQTLSGGIVEEICVQEGSKVKAGETVIKIDSSVNEITLQNITDSLMLLEYENELLNKVALGNDISQEVLPESESKKEEILKYVKTMQDGFKAEKEEADNTIEQALAQVEIEEEALEKIEKNMAYLKKQQELLDIILQYSNTEEQEMQKLLLEIEQKQKTLEDYKKLYAVGAVARVEVEELEDALLQLQKDYEIQNNSVTYEDYENSLSQVEIENQLLMAEKDYNNQEYLVKQAQVKYKQAKDSLTTLEMNFQANITSRIVENDKNINTLKSNQQIQRIGVEEQTIVSPVDGVVRTLEINTIGGVVASTQTIATIVPDDSQMIVEIDIQNRDIGYIQVGQEAVIKLDTFDFQEYGKLQGIVTYIAPDAVWVDNYGWVYKAKITIDEKGFKEKNPDVEIGVGMECTAEVKIGERRIIDFFLEPLVEHFDGSLKVR